MVQFLSDSRASDPVVEHDDPVAEADMELELGEATI